MSFSDVSPATATGYVVVPPAAGVAEFGGVLGDGLLFPLVQAAVQAGGQFTGALPGVPGQLPAAGNVGVLPYLPSAAQCCPVRNCWSSGGSGAPVTCCQ